MSYPLFLTLGFLASWWISKQLPRQLELSASQKTFICLIGFSVAVFAAKLPFLLFRDSDLHNSGSIFFSGKTILLGLVGGYAGVELAKWRLGIKEKTGDRFAVPVAVGIGVGRFGCFFGGCCYGTETSLPWAIVFSWVDAAGLVGRHPTQIYESLFHFTMAAILYRLLIQKRLQGQLIKVYFLSYFAFRFMTEHIRPEIRWSGGLTAYQWAIIVLVPIFVLLWWKDATAIKRGTTGIDVACKK
jgi:phosphatidylglycerol:prolipoprotein diacylglycerol transferase